MTFLESLHRVTGTETSDGSTALIAGEPKSEPKFINSGVGLGKELKDDELDFDTVGEGFSDFFQQGPRINPTLLNMPPDCLTQGPHCHPGGEFSYVVGGEYFDADMDGGVIESYPAGSLVFYSRGSSHRPLSREGARILYIPFDGIVFGKDPEDLARKMVKVGTPAEAIEYALRWMVPDDARRRELEQTLIHT